MEVRKENRENKNKTHTIKRQEIKINERCKTNEKKKLNGKATDYHKKKEKKMAMRARQRKRERKRTRSLQTNNLQSNSGKKEENSQWRENNQKFQFHSLFFAVCLHIFHLSCTQLHCSHFSHTPSISFFLVCTLHFTDSILNLFHLFRFSTFENYQRQEYASVCNRKRMRWKAL